MASKETERDIVSRRVIDAQTEVARISEHLEAAKERRAIVFALAQDHEAMSSGDIARLLPPSVLPHHVAPIVRVGHGLVDRARRRRSGIAA